jgi:hypothetical protein
LFPYISDNVQARFLRCFSWFSLKE